MTLEQFLDLSENEALALEEKQNHISNLVIWNKKY